MYRKTIAMIPARLGSERLKQKNLAILDGKPLITYAIQAAKASEVFSKIVVNSEARVFENIANEYGVSFYHRPDVLGRSDAKSDAVVYDFLKKHSCDILAWVNPTSPLQSPEEIRRIIMHFKQCNLDTLITVENKQVHCVFNGKPVNFSLKGQFERTQDLKPIQSFVYSMMMWKKAIFVKHYEKYGFALLCGKIGYFPVCKESSIIIKTKEDLQMAEAYLLFKKNKL